MKKKELYDALISRGYTEDQLDGKLKSELQDLYDQQEIVTSTNSIPKSTIKEIISKRDKEYWCADGSKIPFNKFDKDPGYIKPVPRAGDKIKEVDGKWVLA